MKGINDTNISNDNLVNTLLKTIKEDIFIIDKDYNIVFANNINYKPAEVIGKKCYHVIHRNKLPCWRLKSKCPLRDIFNTGKNKSITHVHLNSKGQEYYAEINASPIKDKSGNTVYVLEHMKNISDLINREEEKKELIKEKNIVQKYFDIAGVMIVVLDLNGKITKINKKACNILGYDKNEIIGANWFDTFLPKTERTEIKEVFKSLINKKIASVGYSENHIITKDKSIRLIAFHNTNIIDIKRDIIGVLSSGEDITKKRIAKQEVIESENKYRKLTENIPQIIYWKDPKTHKTLSINQAIKNILGYTQKECIDDPMLCEKIIHPEDKKLFLKRLKNGLKTKKSFNMTYRIIKKNGETVWLKNNIFFEFGAKNNIKTIIGILCDITKKKETENIIKENEKRLKSILDSINIGIVIIECYTYKIIDINPKGAQMIGLKSSKIIGNICHKFFCPEHNKKCPINDWHKKIDNTEVTLIQANGKNIEVLKTVTQIILNGKKCFVESFVDISENKKIEKNLIQKNKELENFTKVTVERELRMIRLKKEIMDLKNEKKL